jgi:hypothetical protein
MENRDIKNLDNILLNYELELSSLKNKTSKVLRRFVQKDKSYWSKNPKEFEFMVNNLIEITSDMKCIDKCRNDSIIELTYE